MMIILHDDDDDDDDDDATANGVDDSVVWLTHRIVARLSVPWALLRGKRR